MFCYMYVAIQRKKENPTGDHLCFRHIHEPGCSLNPVVALKQRTQPHPGVWRIYRSVNRRDMVKAQQELLCELIRWPNKYICNITGVWKSILMQPKCKAEKNWLIDIDTNDVGVRRTVREFIIAAGADVLITKITPNGCHLVTSGFDTRKFKFDNVEIKKDALVFVERFEQYV